MEEAFTPAERDALYKAIFSRRDVRGQFRPDPVSIQVLGFHLRVFNGLSGARRQFHLSILA